MLLRCIFLQDQSGRVDFLNSAGISMVPEEFR